MNIKTFKIGDVITRNEPAEKLILTEDKYGMPDMIKEYLYDEVGEPLEFMGLEHSTIYLKGELYNLKLPVENEENIDWTEGWELYKGPKIKVYNDKKAPNAMPFYSGIVFFLFAGVIMIASGVSDHIFYSFMAFFVLSMVSFTIYLTSLWK